ncbi:hypothetical protein K5X82_05275 [Halosquirtibacter xylanolyticus]|uniref:hypothetical protein n=1 Tax=Halosquirtibacter xylanolyticus TaxID=3374599 RepID=UPI0037481120|nr:hypothetical protein K5X82_05275 [Prolixibacteraceae bacterium]
MMQYIAKKWKSKVIPIFLICLAIMAMVAPHDACAQKCMSGDLKAEKIAYLTDYLSLTPQESQEFWPLYNEYRDKRHEIHDLLKSYFKQIKEMPKDASDKEVDSLSESILKTVERENTLLRLYQTKFAKVLGGHKALRLYLAERNYRMYLMKKYRRGSGKGRGPMH